MMITTPASTSNQTTKVKRPMEGGFCVIFSFWVLFCDESSFFSLCFFQTQNVFSILITKKLVITYKLSTIEGFYRKMNDFATVLVFF